MTRSCRVCGRNFDAESAVTLCGRCEYIADCPKHRRASQVAMFEFQARLDRMQHHAASAARIRAGRLAAKREKPS